MRFVFRIWNLIKRAWHKLVYVPVMKMQLGSHGSHVNIGKGARGTWENVHTGSYVSIGVNCLLLSTRAQIKIGDYVILAQTFQLLLEIIALMLSEKECMRLRMPINVQLMIKM